MLCEVKLAVDDVISDFVNCSYFFMSFLFIIVYLVGHFYSDLRHLMWVCDKSQAT